MGKNDLIHPRPGLGWVAEYQASGIPWVTSSLVVPALGGNPLHVNFPTVTRFFVVKNTVSTGSDEAPMRVGFSVNGTTGSTGTKFFVLSNGESFSGELKVTDLYLLSDDVGRATSGTVIAGLTGIPRTELINNWSGSITSVG